MRDAVREAGRGGQSDQSRMADFRGARDARRAADLLKALELAVCLDHPAAILVALFFLGGERLAQLEMRHDLRKLRRRSAQQPDFILGELASPEGLHRQ